ncbi:MAG: carbon-nitrogen family hydrolase [Lachnospiraceae bacterium]|jgi:predicted amidohydrolase|nr:carbon-nitrogen family hydrolase [Lachnospiraceae bacterium]
MKIALTQMNIQWEEKEANLQKGEQLVKVASEQGADLIIFPEMSFTGYSMNVCKVGEEDPLTPDVVREWSARYRIAIIFGAVTKQNHSGQWIGKNVLMMATEGQIVARYEKLHPFSYQREDAFYERGNNLSMYQYKGIWFSFFICYDLRFPQIFQRVSDMAQVIVVIANWPKERVAHWEILLQARAIENQTYCIGVNRTGEGAGILYQPSSMAFDPFGNWVKAESIQDLLFIEVDGSLSDLYKKEFPLKNDRRTDYETLTY